MENPRDITTNPTEALMRRLAALEERVNQLAGIRGIIAENIKASVVLYVEGTITEVGEFLTAHEGDEPGTLVAALQELPELGGAIETKLYVLFPPPNGWYSI